MRGKEVSVVAWQAKSHGSVDVTAYPLNYQIKSFSPLHVVL
jgi:hypothetical protein